MEEPLSALGPRLSATATATAGAESRGPGAESLLLDPAHTTALDLAALPPPLRPDAALGVLDVTKWFGATSGGARTYLLAKAAYVAARPRLRQVLVVPGAEDRVGSASGVRCYQLRSPEVPGQAPYRLLLRAGTLRRLARHERPQVIEAGSPLLVPWMAARAARELGVPLVAYHHGLLPHALAPEGERRAGRLLRAAAWRYLRRLDRLFALTLVGSDFAAAELRAAGVERVARAPLGVELGLFHPRRRERAAETRRRLALPVDAPVVGFAGRFAPEKRLELLLAAWPTVHRATGAMLVLAGDGPARPRLAALAPRGVALRPFERDRGRLADLLAACDLYVSPGAIETFGLSSLEALACGTPVLSADRGGVAELVARSGAGATFEAGSVASLAEEAVALLRADLPALGARGRAHAEREHAWDVALDRIFAIYAGLGGG